MSKSNRAGELKDGTIATRQGSRSTSAGSRSISGTSVTTAKAKNPQISQNTVNLQDKGNAVRMIQALVGSLGDLVEWKKLTLGDEREVYALIFPVSKWEIDPASGELKPR
jgi:hypothetical protein